jgi:hypothetical protein
MQVLNSCGPSCCRPGYPADLNPLPIPGLRQVTELLVLYFTGLYNEDDTARHWWLTPVILATQEAEIRKIIVQSQPEQIVLKTLS